MFALGQRRQSVLATVAAAAVVVAAAAAAAAVAAWPGTSPPAKRAAGNANENCAKGGVNAKRLWNMTLCCRARTVVRADSALDDGRCSEAGRKRRKRKAIHKEPAASQEQHCQRTSTRSLTSVGLPSTSNRRPLHTRRRIWRRPDQRRRRDGHSRRPKALKLLREKKKRGLR